MVDTTRPEGPVDPAAARWLPAGVGGATVIASVATHECAATPSRLADLANGQLASDDQHALDEHLAVCPSCQATRLGLSRAEQAFASIIGNGVAVEGPVVDEARSRSAPSVDEGQPIEESDPSLEEVESTGDADPVVAHPAATEEAEAENGAQPTALEAEDEAEPVPVAELITVAEANADAEPITDTEPITDPQTAADPQTVKIWAVPDPGSSTSGARVLRLGAAASTAAIDPLSQTVTWPMDDGRRRRAGPGLNRRLIAPSGVLVAAVAIAVALLLSGGSNKTTSGSTTHPPPAPVAASPATKTPTSAKPAKPTHHAAAAVHRRAQVSTKPRHTATTPATSVPASAPAASVPAASSTPAAPSTPAASSPAPTTSRPSSGSSVSITPQGSSLPAQTAPTQGIGSGG